ncbi:transcriptional corepressor LEUNIG_HOMOLOG-like isoform X2 [Gossypium raimondii]|nr:transcriptional corepressor LEUNIG_HOMOLOG-like isoform X2 [Gossypium raimondii]
MQQLQLMRQAQMQRRDPNHPSLGGPVNATGSEGMLGQSNASALAAKMYGERMKHPNAMNSETSQPLLDATVALLKSATNHPGQLVQGNQGCVTAALQQIQEIKGDVNLGGPQRAMPMDPSSIYGQGIMQSKPGIGNTDWCEQAC